MRAVVQRVTEASVTVGGELVAAIGEGLLVFVGVGDGDGEEEVSYVSRKVSGLRIFPDEKKPMNRSVVETGGEVLVVSQFTLYGDARKGRRPSFNEAAEPSVARMLLDSLYRALEAEGLKVKKGRFGASMQVTSTNQGPVTILIDSEKSF